MTSITFPTKSWSNHYASGALNPQDFVRMRRGSSCIYAVNRKHLKTINSFITGCAVRYGGKVNTRMVHGLDAKFNPVHLCIATVIKPARQPAKRGRKAL